MKRSSLLSLILLSALISCTKNPDNSNNLGFTMGRGLFLLNEGNFNRGNGSLAYYDRVTSEIENNIYQRSNGLSLGDIPNSMLLLGDTLLIAVNNSGKIVVVNATTGIRLKSIQGISSPREMTDDGRGSIYVTSLYSDSITLIDRKSMNVAGYINAGMSTEGIYSYSDKMYVTNWSSGNKVLVINKSSKSVSTVIEVGKEPESIVYCADGLIWVLCSGGYLQQELPSLWAINPVSDMSEKSISFRYKSDYPTSLNTTRGGDSLLFLNGDIWRMSVRDTVIPANSFITASGSLFYRMKSDPLTGELFVTDAIDYQRQGNLLVFNSAGKLVDKKPAGIIPGRVTFY